MTTTTANGKPQRKQLSHQLDRLDRIIDAMVEGLPEAVADATRDGTRQAIRDVLTEVLTDPDYQPDPSQAHPLLGKSPPDFELRDDRGQPHKLSEYLDNGPLVLVFYFGYNCNHCVGQLFGLNRDINRFRELGTQVVAISADSPEETAKRFKEYGQFDFPVLSDPGNKVAAAYGVYQPAKEKTVEKLLHGTFVIDSERQVVWCNAGDEPYFHNMTLLHQLAKAQGVLPPPRKKEAHE